MKKLLTAMFAFVSISAFASGGTGGVPNVPCYVSGELYGTAVEITKCEKMGGALTKQASVELSK